MVFQEYIGSLKSILDRIEREQAEAICRAGEMVADALRAGGIIHAFGSGHSHMIAEETFFRAGGLAAVNPILDKRLMLLDGALESSRGEREPGYAHTVLAREDVRPPDAAILISNSGRNAVPIEMAMELKARGIPTIAITNVSQSSATPSRHSSGKRLFELVDLVVDNCTPAGDAVLSLEGLPGRIGPSSTVAGAAIMNSIMIEAAAGLLRTGHTVPLLSSSNVGGPEAEEAVERILAVYRDRIRYF